MVAVTTDVQVACDAGGIPSTEAIRAWVTAAVQGAGIDSGPDIEVAVRIVAADEMQALNRRYRDQDKLTNVLSFGTGTIEGLPAGTPRTLGDIVICAPVVAEEASQQNKRLEDHWAHMLVHGTLHLLGYDHLADTEADEMETLEARVLASGNVTDPYRRA